MLDGTPGRQVTRMFSGIEDFERAIGYESPITQIIGQLETQIEDDCIKVVQQCGFDVNKEELTRALIYDRNQYNKGFKDGYAKALEDFAEKLSNVCCEESFEVRFGTGHFDAGIKADVLTLDGVTEIIWDVAEQLKEGGADNG